VQAAGRHGTAEVARGDRSVDRNAVPTPPTWGQMGLRRRKRDDAASVERAINAPVELVGDREAPRGRRRAGTANSYSEPPDRNTVAADDQCSAGDVSDESDLSVRELQAAVLRVDPDEPVVTEPGLRDGQPAVATRSDDSERTIRAKSRYGANASDNSAGRAGPKRDGRTGLYERNQMSAVLLGSRGSRRSADRTHAEKHR